MRLATLVFFLATSAQASAQDGPGTLAREAADALGAAAVSLSEAKGANDRIAALTQTVRAYEAGLAAMREGLRRAALEERTMRARLQGRDAELGRLFTALIVLERSGSAASLTHPEGVLPAIRAGMLTSEMVPALNERASALAGELDALGTIIALQEAGQAQLEQGLSGIRSARLSLAEAISNRTDLPPRTGTDDAAMEALINSAETLEGFADSLVTGAAPATREGAVWNLPVLGRVIRHFGEADAAGVERPGWVVASEPGALILAPVAATVRYAGPLPDHGAVAILEPRAGELLILAGAKALYVQRGQIVSTGDPIGVMPGDVGPEQEKLIETSVDGGQRGRETLYIELRHGRDAVDPAFRFGLAGR